MAETSFPHDTTGIATESQWATLARLFLGTGLLRGELNEGLNVAPSGLNLGIQSMRAFMDGVWYESTATITKGVGTGHATLDRIDRIALKLDRGANTVTPVVIAGTPSGSPSPPTLTNTPTVVYSKLYQVRTNATHSSIDTVSDERVFASHSAWGGEFKFGTFGTGATSADATISAIHGDIDMQDGTIRLASASVVTHSATGGSDTLPGSPAGFITIKIDGSNKRIPFYG